MLNMSAAVEIKHAIVTQHVQGCRQDLLMQRIELADISPTSQQQSVVSG